MRTPLFPSLNSPPRAKPSSFAYWTTLCHGTWIMRNCGSLCQIMGFCLVQSLLLIVRMCDMVAIACIINAALVIPELDKNSFCNFSGIFDEERLIKSLVNDVKIIEKLPNKLVNATEMVMWFNSWSSMDYYENKIAAMWDDYTSRNY